jgi:hypothetical protein
MLHSSVLPVQTFERAWETSKEVLRTKQDETGHMNYMFLVIGTYLNYLILW